MTFGLAPIKTEGKSTTFDSAEPSTDEGKCSVWMELSFDFTKQTREDVHREVDEWLDSPENRAYIAHCIHPKQSKLI